MNDVNVRALHLYCLLYSSLFQGPLSTVRYTFARCLSLTQPSFFSSNQHICKQIEKGVNVCCPVNATVRYTFARCLCLSQPSFFSSNQHICKHVEKVNVNVCCPVNATVRYTFARCLSLTQPSFFSSNQHICKHGRLAGVIKTPSKDMILQPNPNNDPKP